MEIDQNLSRVFISHGINNTARELCMARSPSLIGIYWDLIPRFDSSQARLSSN